MNRIMMAVGAILLIILLYVGATYNRLVNTSESVDTQWGQVQTVYQRRLDLIPNLVGTVKGYATHERETFTAVTEARASAGKTLNPQALANADQFKQFAQSQAALRSALSRLLVTVERYPDLKANQNFLALQTQLEGTENRISVERNRFNRTVKDYNVLTRRFPSALVAKAFGFETKPYFEAEPVAAKAPKVEF